MHIPLSPCVSELVSRLQGQAERLRRFRSCGGGILFFLGMIEMVSGLVTTIWPCARGKFI